MSTTILYNLSGMPIMGGELFDVEPKMRNNGLPGLIESSIQYLLVHEPVVRRGQWISRKGLPCASDDLTEEEAKNSCVVRPHRHRVRKAGKFYSTY